MLKCIMTYRQVAGLGRRAATYSLVVRSADRGRLMRVEKRAWVPGQGRSYGIEFRACYKRIVPADTPKGVLPGEIIAQLSEAFNIDLTSCSFAPGGFHLWAKMGRYAGATTREVRLVLHYRAGNRIIRRELRRRNESAVWLEELVKELMMDAVI